MKITFMGAGSTVFARNVLGDCMCTPALRESEIALYDIDKQRLEDSEIILNAINKNVNESRAKISTYLGVENRKDALRGASFVVNAIQVGLYDPCTITDFEIPKKYGLRQTIADTLGIGGIMRGLRTIPVLEDFARDMQEVCPDAWFLNYTNPMAILTGYMTRYSGIKTVGLCHSVQSCSRGLLEHVGMLDEAGEDNFYDKIAGINHMAWLLEIHDKQGNDLYPEIKRRALEINAKALASSNKEDKHGDMVRFEYIKRLGYYCTESSEHNSEYNMFFIKDKYPNLIDDYNIPLDEYPRRCIEQIAGWEKQKAEILANGEITHTRCKEYASYIMEAMVTNNPYKIGGNVLNTGLIDNLPADACVEVPCLVDASGVTPCYMGKLPVQLAAMNMTNINPQLLTIEAAVRGKRSIFTKRLYSTRTQAQN